MLFDMLHEVDRLRSALLSTTWGLDADGARTVQAPMNIYRDNDRYVLDADLPGADPRSIDVTVDGRWLTIRADRSETHEAKDGEWLVRERTAASTVRRIALGDDADADRIEATYHDGVLSVTIPVAEDARPRKIQIETGHASERPALDAAAAAPADPAEGAQTAGAGKEQPAHSHAA